MRRGPVPGPLRMWGTCKDRIRVSRPASLPQGKSLSESADPRESSSLGAACGSCRIAISEARLLPPGQPASLLVQLNFGRCADRVVIFDHTVRRRVDGAADVRGAGPRQPATRVHVDQTDASGANRVREHLPAEADELLKGRVQVINLWHPIRGPVRDTPLALCDATSLVASDLIYPNRNGETYSVKFNPIHRWFYFPEMTADEGLLLKCYDSATDGRARFAPHTAFVDPTTPKDAPPRESIELRTLVFHRK
jgi:hypothetical protein